MEHQSNRALFTFVPWSNAVRAILMAGVFCGSIWAGAAMGDKSITGQMGSLMPITLAALSCVMVATGSAWSRRWSFYPHSVVLSRFGRRKTELPFRALDSVLIRVDDEDRPLVTAAVAKIRQRLDGETPSIFYVTMRGKDATGMPAALTLTSIEFNKHEEARWFVSYLLAHCPTKKRQIAPLAGNVEGFMRVMGCLLKWVVLFVGFTYFWEQVYMASV